MRRLAALALLLATNARAEESPHVSASRPALSQVLATPPDAGEAAHFVASLVVADGSHCVDATTLSADVGARLERRAFSTSSADAHVAVEVQGGRELTARVILRRRDGSLVGSRTITTTGGCATLRDGLALVVALLLDMPSSEVRVRLPPPPENPRELRAGPPPSSVAFAVEARAEVASGALPSQAAGVGAGVSAGVGATRAGLEAVVFPGARAKSDTGFADVGLLLFGAFGCWSHRFSRSVRLGPCVHVGGGKSYARGERFASSRDADALRVDLGALVRGEVGLAGPLGLVIGAGPVLSPARARVVYEDGSGERRDLFVASPVWLRGYAGLSLSFSSEP